MMEQTLVILKPDAVRRGLMGEILQRFERAGFRVVQMELRSPEATQFYRHYEEIGKLVSRRWEDVYNLVLVSMVSGPVVTLVLEWVNAIENVRKMVGATEPKSALPGTIRGDYAHMSFAHADASKKAIENLIHASANPEEAAQEIKLWFGK